MLLGQVGLFRLRTSDEVNYLMSPVAQTGGYHVVRLMKPRDLFHRIPNKVDGGTKIGGGLPGLGKRATKRGGISLLCPWTISLVLLVSLLNSPVMSLLI